MNQKKHSLGKGLEALIPNVNDILNEGPTGGPAGQPLMARLDLLDPNPDQPRRDFKEQELSSLAQSIKAKGIVIPLMVNALPGGRFQIVAGERRFRAAKMAGLAELPVIVKPKPEDPSDSLVSALLENLCREDLNPIEEAESFNRLERDFGRTHQEIAMLTGRERPTVTNAIRLLRLPGFIQDDIRAQRLTPGHGRAMLGLKDEKMFDQLRAEVIAKKLNVRQTESLVRKFNRPPAAKPAPDGDDPYLLGLAMAFSQALDGLKVRITPAGRHKKLEIFYNNTDQLEGLMKLVGVPLDYKQRPGL